MADIEQREHDEGIIRRLHSLYNHCLSAETRIVEVVMEQETLRALTRLKGEAPRDFRKSPIRLGSGLEVIVQLNHDRPIEEGRAVHHVHCPNCQGPLVLS